MSEQMSEQIAQQTIAPAYVWHDEKQRAAWLTRTALALEAGAKRDQLQLARPLIEATIAPTYLKAVVGAAQLAAGESVDFVAYEPVSDPSDADLVMIFMSLPVVATR